MDTMIPNVTRVNLSSMGLNLAGYHRAGTSDVTFILLHGWLDCAASFSFVIKHLPEHWNIFALDWRGHGLSEHQAYGYYFPAYLLADLLSWIEHVSPQKKVNLIGHSMGGMLAASFTGAMGEKVAKLAMLEGFGLADESIVQVAPSVANFLKQLKKPKVQRHLGTFDDVARSLMTQNQKLPAARAEFLARALAHETADGRLIYRHDVKHRLPRPGVYRLDETLVLWQQIACPVLWVEAEAVPHNRYLIDIAETLDFRAAHIPQAQRVKIAGSGHMMHWEAPETLARHLTEFFEA